MPTMSRWLGPVSILVLVACVAAPGRAQTSAQDEEAHRRFEAGQLAFGDGRYETALSDFRAAYELSHHAELLYNVGQCADRLRRDADALEAFERYLREAGDGARYRREVEARLDVLRAAVARGTAAAPDVTLPVTTASEPADGTAVPIDARPDEPSEGSSSASIATGPAAEPIVVAVVGAALLVGGAVCLGLGEVDRATVEHPASDATWPAIADAAGRGPVLEGVGIAGLVVGAIGMAVGIVWAVSGASARAEVRASLSGLSIQGAF
jgi:tetratricopeptide (TPR) repeat protein